MVRAITAIVLGAAVIAAVWFLPPLGLTIVIFAIAAAGLAEFSRIFLKDAFEWFVAFAGGLAVAATMLFAERDAVPAVIAVVLFLLSMAFMWRTKELRGVADRLGIATLGILYLGVSFPLWSWLRGMYWGKELVVLTLVPACLCDTFAFIAGKTLGRRKFAPSVSPNKTVEGFIGALAGSLAGTLVTKAILLPHMQWRVAVAFAVMIWIVSPLGDLIESMLKRSAGVKDSGTVIPGHGGVLDRLDALIFSGPAAYVFLKYIAQM